MAALLLGSGVLLCAIGAIVTLPLVRRFHLEAKKVGYDIWEPQNVFDFFRIRRLPPSLQALTRSIRARSIAFFWSGAALIVLGMIVLATRQPNQTVQNNAVNPPRNSGAALVTSRSSRRV